MNGGTCAVSNATGEEFCVCPPGSSLGQDFDWFHFPNCVRHVDAAKHFFIQYVILASVLCAVFLKLIVFDFKSDARIIAILAASFIFTLIWFVLGFYLQDGCYEVCSVFANAAFILVDICMGKIIVVVMRPLYMMQNESFKQFRAAIYIWTGVLALAVVGAGVAMTATCRDAMAVWRFNTAAIVSTGLLWIGGITQISFTLIASYRLKQKVVRTAKTVNDQNQRLDTRTKGLLRRIEVLQGLIGVILLPFTALLIAVPIILSYMSSFPYYYIIEYMEIELSLLFGLAILVFLRQEGQTITSSKNRQNSSAVSTASKYNRRNTKEVYDEGTLGERKLSKDGMVSSRIRSSRAGESTADNAVVVAAEPKW